MRWVFRMVREPPLQRSGCCFGLRTRFVVFGVVVLRGCDPFVFHLFGVSVGLLKARIDALKDPGYAVFADIGFHICAGVCVKTFKELLSFFHFFAEDLAKVVHAGDHIRGHKDEQVALFDDAVLDAKQRTE